MSKILRVFIFATLALSVLSACSANRPATVIPSSTNSNVPETSSAKKKLALTSNGGMMHSFSDAVGMHLQTDADYGGFIDPQITGADRTLALSLLRIMPANKRGDFIYIKKDGSAFSNRLSLKNSFTAKPASRVQREMRADVRHNGRKIASYPPTGGSNGPYIRNFSAPGVTAGLAYATIPCGSTLDTNDHGFMYFNAYSATSSGSVVDGGLEVYPGDVGHPFLNVNHNYIFSGWTNQGATFPCGTDPTGRPKQAVGILFGSLFGTNTIVLAIGNPDYSPYQYALPPDKSTWTGSAWIFYPTGPAELFSSPGQWQGISTPCTGCSVARMFTIGQTFANSNVCFGACNGFITGRWDQTVMGELTQPCQQVPNQYAQCTIEYTTNGSWYGNENDSGKGIFFSEPSINNGSEGINLQYTGRNNPILQSAGTFGPLEPLPPLIQKNFYQLGCPVETLDFYPGTTDYAGNTVPPGYEYIWHIYWKGTCPP